MPPQAPRQPRTTGHALIQAALASLAVVAICAAKPADRTYTPTPTVATVPVPRSSKPGAMIEVAPTAAAPSGRPRVALVLANGQYSAPAKPLPQAHPDAWHMADALAASGFDVRVLEDGDKRAMELALVDLVRRVQQTGGAEAALVYYAGHGAKVP